MSDMMQLSDIEPIFDMNKSKKSCSTSTVKTTSQQFQQKVMRNLECTSESTEIFSHPTYLPLKDAINIAKHQHTPGTQKYLIY